MLSISTLSRHLASRLGCKVFLVDCDMDEPGIRLADDEFSVDFESDADLLDCLEHMEEHGCFPREVQARM